MSAFLEDYTLIEELGKGGFATVYKVRHNKLKYIRAVKVLNETIATGESDKTFKKFLDECRVLLRLGNGNHPNIVHIYQPLLREHKALVEMDYIDGYDLYKLLSENNNFIKIDDIIQLVEQMSNALAYCHHNIYKFCMDRDEDNLEDDPNDGSKVLLDDSTISRLIEKYRVIHNDIHPGNIIRHRDGRYMLLDFGLAVEGDSVVRSSRRRNGAPEYKAPEKWEDDGTLSTQSDIYSMGIVLYHMLAGRVPFPFDPKQGGSIEAEYRLSKAHKSQTPDSIFGLRKSAYEAKYPGETYDEPDYPEWLEELIMKALAKRPEDRFADGLEMHEFVSNNLKADKERAKELISGCEEKQTKLQQMEGYIAALQENIVRLKQENQSLAGKNTNLESGNNTATEIFALQNELQTLKQQLSSKYNEIEVWRARYNSLNEQVRQGEVLVDVNEEVKSTKKSYKKLIITLLLGVLTGAVVVFGYGYYRYSMNGGDSGNTPPIISPSDLSRWKRDLGAKNKELEVVKSENEALKSSKGEDAAEIERLKEMIRVLEHEKADQEAIIQKRLDEIEKLNSRLNNEL